jgi:opacity protein-like surface antigen
MRRNVLGMVLALVMLASASFAQRVSSSNNTYNHAEAGVFVNYTRLHNADNTNFFGFGGRLGFNVNPSVQLEAEGAYDFQRNVDAQVIAGPGGTSFTTVRSGLRMAHFMFGPKFQTPGPVKFFVTAKGGLINFSTDTSFPSQVNNIPVGDTNGVFYPAGGVEFYAGWIGMRLEAGDEMYFDRGANHNLRVTVGPTIRF